MVLTRMFALITSLFMLSPQAYSYVFLTADRPKLKPADSQTQVFYLTSTAPVFADKGSFEDGIYADMDDDELFEALVRRSMAYWNEIPGLSIQLRVGEERKGAIDPEDNIFSIGIGRITSVASGLAFPVPDDNEPGRLRDCDVQVGSDIDSIPSFIFVMVHEFGHCLGLGHNHSDPNAIMGYWQPRGTIALGADDIAGVLSLYPPQAGEATQRFAPCGSLPGVLISSAKNDPTGRSWSSVTEASTVRRGAWLGSLLMLAPLVIVAVPKVLRSSSCRRRRRWFVR